MALKKHLLHQNLQIDDENEYKLTDIDVTMLL